MRQIVEVFEQVQHRRLVVVGAFTGEVRVPPHEPAHHRQMRGEPLREERRSVVGRAQHHARRHRCRPPFGREGTRRRGRFFRCRTEVCGGSGGSSERLVARGRHGRGSSIGRRRFFRRCVGGGERPGGSSERLVARGCHGRGSNVGRGRRRGLHSGARGSVRRSSGCQGSIDCRGGIHCRRRGAIHRRGGTWRRIAAPFRRCGAGCGARFRGGERRAAQGFVPARRSGRPKGTRGRFDANRRAIRRRIIGFHGVVLFFFGE